MTSEENLNQEQLSVDAQEPVVGEAVAVQDPSISARQSAWSGVEIAGAVLDIAFLGFGLYMVYYVKYVLPQGDPGPYILFVIPMLGAYLFSFIIALLLRKGHRDFSALMMFLTLVALLFSFGFFGK